MAEINLLCMRFPPSVKTILLGFFLVGGFLFWADAVSAVTEVEGLIRNEQTWTLSGSPYLVKSAGFGVAGGGVLTIEPGVIVKFVNNSELGTGSGKIIANGTQEKPIIFTSIADDSAGGDTNGDGAGTTPSTGDWRRISLGNDGDQLSFTQIRYAARCININSASTFVKNSTIRDCGIGMDLNMPGPNTLIQNNTIRNNGTGVSFIVGDQIDFSQNNIHDNILGAENLTPQNEVDLRDNWWGDPTGPFHLTKNPQGKGNKVSDAILFSPWLNQEAGKQTRNPVIIVPGILGSDLYNGDEIIWLDLGRMFKDINDQFLTENLSLSEDGNSINSITPVDVIRKRGFSAFTLDIFYTLIRELEKEGYVLNETYFVFPYDWRIDLNLTMENFRQRIDQIKTQTGKTKVDIIAHSMGGLLIKSYVNEFSGTDLDKLIFVGTPHLGAPKAAKTLLHGDRFGIYWLEEDTMRDLSRNSISAYELIPNEKYFEQFAPYIKPHSLFGTRPPLNYADTKTFLLEKGLNNRIFQKADDFNLANLHNLDLSGIKVYNIAGCRRGTQAGYHYGKDNKQIVLVRYTSGDETVPLVSANYINTQSENKFYVRRGKHSELPSTAGVRELIVQILQGTPPTLADNISRDEDFCDFRGKEMLWKSPVEVHIYDSQGNHTGPIEDNAIEYGVDGVGYEIIDEEKFIFLPTDEGENYQISTNGQKEGTFDLLISENDNGSILNTTVFNDIEITGSTKISFQISEQTKDDEIQVDLMGNGDIESIKADSILDPTGSEDLAPPETKVLVAGTPGEKGWYISDVTITLEAMDDNAGILETKYSLDGGDTFQLYSGPVSISNEGSNKLQYFSVDRAGNNEELNVLEVKIDKTPPEMSVKYDLEKMDFVFQGLDTMDANPVLVCDNILCTAIDQAGHKTMLNFSKSAKHKPESIELQSITYNDLKFSFTKNFFDVKVKKSKDVIKDFDQKVVLKKVIKAQVHYQSHKNQSRIVIRPRGEPSDQEFIPGFVFLQIYTDSGKINIDY